MRESVTHQTIREEGRAQEARELLLDLGTEKLGRPDPATAATIEAVDDLAALHRMGRAVLRANSWQELPAAGQG